MKGSLTYDQIREIEIPRTTEYVGQCVKIRMSKKKLCLISNHDEIQFQKKYYEKQDGLEIATVSRKYVTERCNLGHNHTKPGPDEVWAFMGIPWPHVDTLVEWLQLGPWSKQRKKGN